MLFSLLSIKVFWRSFPVADTAFSQRVVAVLKTKMRSPRAQSFAAIFAVTDDPLLRRARTKQVCQVVRTSMAVRPVQPVMCVSWESSQTVSKLDHFGCPFEREHYSARRLAKKTAAAKTSPPESVPVSTLKFPPI